jgi:hypothetical protein
MPLTEECLLCGRSDTERAHVKPRREFDSPEDDRYHNIIPLCRIHHNDYFDTGRIGICPGKGKLVVEQSPGNLEVLNLDRPINIKDEYVEYRNSLCKDRIRHAMGLTHEKNRNLCRE